MGTGRSLTAQVGAFKRGAEVPYPYEDGVEIAFENIRDYYNLDTHEDEMDELEDYFWNDDTASLYGDDYDRLERLAEDDYPEALLEDDLSDMQTREAIVRAAMDGTYQTYRPEKERQFYDALSKNGKTKFANDVRKRFDEFFEKRADVYWRAVRLLEQLRR